MKNNEIKVTCEDCFFATPIELNENPYEDIYCLFFKSIQKYREEKICLKKMKI